MDIRQRVKRLDWVLGKDLLANPKNWRRHPDSQRAALRALGLVLIADMGKVQ